MINAFFLKYLEEKLSVHFEMKVSILRISTQSGGCINHAHKLETTFGNLFVKFNSSLRFPGMFEAEAKGLELLESTKSIRVPEVILIGNYQAYSFIILDFIENGKQRGKYWENAGMQLAQLHRFTNESFGLDHDNYIGSLHQSNKKHSEWPDFFMNERILPLAAELEGDYIDKFQNKLRDLFPKEPPALIHGDLWNGNIMCGADGRAVFYDPAVYYGHREMDLAMTKLFGGFPESFYAAYHAEYPLHKGFEDRVEWYNLYPLLVHAKLFGGTYANQAISILKKL